ncbi:DUF4878 domain-containing protein [Ginsengibacter hankyongi]|uniref:DUF4878 domain-containing protein n=1 Tax=Ginsengibacter hankyongi TaxID=2607284 RepID=A0A5J5IDG5_9BACT|nr:DUF4878 domain-containing protein [Ginsengibacter hankyongi]KAA9037662.1 DUF4878 domain-containing protein [Ginsengibacter hankyongi]
MNKLIIGILAIIFTILACKHSAEVSKRDPLESGRGFIESSLKGDYDEAQKYLLQDSINMQYFEGLKDFNSKRSDVEKEGYKNANILIDSTQQLSDSVTIITYSNTYKNKPSRLKMVKKNNEWLVDFKYTFNSNM